MAHRKGRIEHPFAHAICISSSQANHYTLTAFCFDDRFSMGFNFFQCRSCSSFAFWRVDNSVCTFIPADASHSHLKVGAYELRHFVLRLPEVSPKASKSSDQAVPSGPVDAPQSERPVAASSGRLFEPVASFQLIWWNQNSSSRKKLSIWRPVVPQGMVYFGDIAVQGYAIFKCKLS